jgi:hypothetical protein
MLSEATLVDATATVAVSSKALHRPNMFIYNQYKYITAVDLLVFFFTAYHSISYWLLYSLPYRSSFFSRVISFSIVIGVSCTQLNLLLCFLARVFNAQK